MAFRLQIPVKSLNNKSCPGLPLKLTSVVPLCYQSSVPFLNDQDFIEHLLYLPNADWSEVSPLALVSPP